VPPELPLPDWANASDVPKIKIDAAVIIVRFIAFSLSYERGQAREQIIVPINFSLRMTRVRDLLGRDVRFLPTEMRDHKVRQGGEFLIRICQAELRHESVALFSLNMAPFKKHLDQVGTFGIIHRL
jgi:hypothetical protein